MKFSIVIESPNEIKVGTLIEQDGQVITVTSIRKVEFVNGSAVLVSGNGIAKTR